MQQQKITKSTPGFKRMHNADWFIKQTRDMKEERERRAKMYRPLPYVSQQSRDLTEPMRMAHAVNDIVYNYVFICMHFYVFTSIFKGAKSNHYSRCITILSHFGCICHVIAVLRRYSTAFNFLEFY